MAAGRRSNANASQNIKAPLAQAAGLLFAPDDRDLAQVTITGRTFGIGDAIRLLGVTLRRRTNNLAILGRTPPTPAILCFIDFPKIAI